LHGDGLILFEKALAIGTLIDKIRFEIHFEPPFGLCPGSPSSYAERQQPGDVDVSDRTGSVYTI
jgi:hypothetical protein